MALLYLGSCDASKFPNDKKEFLKPYHKDGLLIDVVSFRDDNSGKWRQFRSDAGTEVEALQRFLMQAGFMTNRIQKFGIFDYATQAAVRLFQEYVRTIDKEGDKTMVPDGLVGSITMKHVDRWIAEDKVCSWGLAAAANPTKEYNDWFELLHKAKAHYKANPGPILKHLNTLPKTYSTRKADEWTFDKNQIHLIGIRRNQHLPRDNRENDDVFILLINGLVFKFWGSTDPNVKESGRWDEAFLVEGQHEYRFGWHKITVERKIHRALKPLNANGVIIVRDWDNSNSLTPKDLEMKDSNGKLLGLLPNNEINIHWSGIGSYNWSAGCQVISGKSYINNKGKAIKCSYAATSYGGSKGAYSLLADLVIAYSKPGVSSLLYTLGREESLNIDENFGANYAKNALDEMTSL